MPTDAKPVWNPLADQIAFHCPDVAELELVFVTATYYVVRVAEFAGSEQRARVLAGYSSVGLAESDLRGAGFERAAHSDDYRVHTWRWEAGDAE